MCIRDREGIGLRAMAQRDPLVEYQREGYDMFMGMLDGLKEESVGFLFNVQVEPSPNVPRVAPVATPQGLADLAENNLAEGNEPALRAKGLGGDDSRPLTYVGPSEDGNAEVQDHDGNSGRSGKLGRKERRQAAREQTKERRLLRRR